MQRTRAGAQQTGGQHAHARAREHAAHRGGWRARWAHVSASATSSTASSACFMLTVVVVVVPSSSPGVVTAPDTGSLLVPAHVATARSDTIIRARASGTRRTCVVRSGHGSTKLIQ